MDSTPPSVIPMLSYEHAAAAIEWQVRVFGFRECERFIGDDGLVSHAELRLGDGVIFLANGPAGYQGPRKHAETCATTRAWQASRWVVDGQLVYVDQIDAHYEHAKSAGAVILTDVEDGYPGRRYRAEDCEGHRWMFMQKPAAARRGDVDARLARHGGLSYLEIPAIDVRQSAGFYQNVFGWTLLGGETDHPKFFDPTGHLLGRWVTGRAIAREPGLLPFIYVDDIEAAVNRAVENSGEIVKPIYPEGTLRVAHVRDPAGNVIGVWTPTTNSE